MRAVYGDGGGSSDEMCSVHHLPAVMVDEVPVIAVVEAVTVIAGNVVGVRALVQTYYSLIDGTRNQFRNLIQVLLLCPLKRSCKTLMVKKC